MSKSQTNSSDTTTVTDATATVSDTPPTNTATIYDFSLPRRDGTAQPMSDFKGKVLLIVNTATGCGFTPQYEGLEQLYEKYHDQGLEILDFPCDQFGHQAPGSDDEIHQFCTAKYHTQFDQYAKVEVIGDQAHPLFHFIITHAPAPTPPKGLKDKLALKALAKLTPNLQPTDIKWNFTKFLINRDGKVVARFDPTTPPADIDSAIAEQLSID